MAPIDILEPGGRLIVALECSDAWARASSAALRADALTGVARVAWVAL